VRTLPSRSLAGLPTEVEMQFSVPEGCGLEFKLALIESRPGFPPVRKRRGTVSSV
jgi:hypothetical protein